jgi:Virulence-associated protein E
VNTIDSATAFFEKMKTITWDEDTRAEYKALPEEARKLFDQIRKAEHFAHEHETVDSRKETLSPSGKYKLVLSWFSTGPNSWSYSQGTVYRKDDDKPIATVQRNYSSFPHTWVEGHPNGHDFFVCGEDYQGQTVIELDTGKRRDELSEGTDNGWGFCWASHRFDAPSQILVVDGCHWACPYEFRFYDFSDPMSGWPCIVSEELVEDDKKEPEIAPDGTITCFQTRYTEEDENEKPKEPIVDVRMTFRREGLKLVLVEEWVSDYEQDKRKTSPEGLPFWIDQAYNSYMRGLDDRATKLLEYSERLERMRDRLLKSRTSLPKPSKPDQQLQESGESIETENEEEESPEPWEGPKDSRLIMTTIKGPEGPVQVPKSCGANARTVLNFDPYFRGNIRFNQLSHDIEVIDGDFKDVNGEVLGTEVNNYLQTYYSIDVGSLECERQILALAYENSYDPLLDYLNPLEAQWDGNERLSFFLEYFCDAPLVDTEDKDISVYVRTISLRWFIGAVARALSPGCQMDNVLVLEGGQGDRKTSLLRALFRQFFATAHLDITDKDTKMMAGSTWGIELAELSSLKRSETEAQKAFFTILFDKFRPPYGRRLQNTPRRCVFVGTTNAATYLTDITGNRRYWPIMCGPAMFERLKELTDYVRDQLWAEAVVRFRRFQATSAGTASTSRTSSSRTRSRPCTKRSPT